jgi:hypothetical protein
MIFSPESEGWQVNQLLRKKRREDRFSRVTGKCCGRILRYSHLTHPCGPFDVELNSIPLCGDTPMRANYSLRTSSGAAASYEHSLHEQFRKLNFKARDHIIQNVEEDQVSIQYAHLIH